MLLVVLVARAPAPQLLRVFGLLMQVAQQQQSLQQQQQEEER
jgi:hypothetical protein